MIQYHHIPILTHSVYKGGYGAGPGGYGAGPGGFGAGPGGYGPGGGAGSGGVPGGLPGGYRGSPWGKRGEGGEDIDGLVWVISLTFTLHRRQVGKYMKCTL